ncbi:MAG: AAA family ATPase [Croceibacterium sp.]
MNGAVIAVYSLKGGVGKTTLAVNLAWAAAREGKRVLVWDLDGQAAATYMLGGDAESGKAGAAIRKASDPKKLITPTAVARLDLLPADASLRDLDVLFHDLDKKKHLAKLADRLPSDYDVVVIDCPPGLTDTSEQVLRAADLVVVPVIPSPLSRRALAAVEAHVADEKAMSAPLLPVFSMVDRRRALHRAALEAEPQWPVIPMASVFEAMSDRRAPLGAFVSARHAGVQAVNTAWAAVAAALKKGRK